MKRLTILLLVISSLTIMMGCNKSNSNSNIDGNNNEVLSNTEEKKNNESNSYISLYKANLQQIKEIYSKRNLECYEENTDNKNFNGVSLLYFSNTEANVNEISYAKYEIGFNSKDEANTLGAVVAEKVSEEELKNNDYTIDGTIFEDFAEVMVKNSEYKNDVEQAVNDYFKNNGKNIVFLEYDDVDINLEFYSDEISYQIIMKP